MKETLHCPSILAQASYKVKSPEQVYKFFSDAIIFNFLPSYGRFFE